MDSPQQVCENYPAFLNMVFAMAMSPDPSQIPVALDTLGVLGGTVEGKQVLHKTGVCVWCQTIQLKSAFSAESHIFFVV